MEKEQIKIEIIESDNSGFTVDFEGELSLSQKINLQTTLCELQSIIALKLHEHYNVLRDSILSAKKHTEKEDFDNEEIPLEIVFGNITKIMDD